MGVVISFRNPRKATGPKPELSDASRATLVERPFDGLGFALKIIGMQHKVKLDLDAAIASIGIVLVQGRRTKDLILDPEGRRRFERHIELIEAMLEVARLKVASLRTL